MSGQLGASGIDRGAGFARFGQVGRAVGALEGTAVTDLGLAVGHAVRALRTRVSGLPVEINVGVVDEFLAAYLTKGRTVGAGSYAISSLPGGSGDAIATSSLAISERGHTVRVLLAFASHARGWATFLVDQDLTRWAIDNALTIDHFGFPTYASVILAHQRWTAGAFALVTNFRWSWPANLCLLIDSECFEIQWAIANSIHTNGMRSSAILVVQTQNSRISEAARWLNSQRCARDS